MASSPPQFVYDDDCGFCTWTAEFVARRSDVEVVGFSELTPERRARLPPDYESCAHFLTGEAVYSCGRAVEAALAQLSPLLDHAFALARRLPLYAAARERAYRRGADHRDLFGRFLSR